MVATCPIALSALSVSAGVPLFGCEWTRPSGALLPGRFRVRGRVVIECVVPLTCSVAACSRCPGLPACRLRLLWVAWQGLAGDSVVVVVEVGDVAVVREVGLEPGVGLRPGGEVAAV